MAVPYTFGSATTSIPLSQLDSNFATTITLGNTAIQLGNTVTTLNNMTLANVTVSSGNVIATNVTATIVTSPASTALTLQSAGTTAITVDTSQNVGIGTSSPAAKFQTNSTDGTIAVFRTTSGANNGRLNIDISDSAATAGFSIGGNSTFPAMTFANGGTERMRIDSSGNVLVTNPAGLGYGTGSGGTVTQATSKSTAVTLNKPTGQITTNNAALASGATVSFSVNNSIISATDNILVVVTGGSSYTVQPAFVSGGVFSIRLTNTTGGSLSEAVAINFAVIKGATS